jgi:thiamine pyrophosphate-dependent acetolactate synthase large subunit-like protein
MVSTAITTAVAGRGPVVISLPGDVARADAPAAMAAVGQPACQELLRQAVYSCPVRLLAIRAGQVR